MKGKHALQEFTTRCEELIAAIGILVEAGADPYSPLQEFKTDTAVSPRYNITEIYTDATPQAMGFASPGSLLER